MTYSFNVRAPSKAAAIDMVRGKMRNISVAQPVHNRDDLHVLATAKTFIDMLQDDAARDVFVSVNGGIGTAEGGVQSIAVSISTNLVNRQAA